MGARPNVVALSITVLVPCKAAIGAIGRGAAKAINARTTCAPTTAVRSDEVQESPAITAMRRHGPSTEVLEARGRLPSIGHGETQAKTTTTTRTEKRLFSTDVETSGPTV